MAVCDRDLTVGTKDEIGESINERPSSFLVNETIQLSQSFDRTVRIILDYQNDGCTVNKITIGKDVHDYWLSKDCGLEMAYCGFPRYNVKMDPEEKGRIIVDAGCKKRKRTILTIDMAA